MSYNETKKIEHFQNRVDEDPENGKKRAELICVLLAEGLRSEAIEAINLACQELPKKLRLPEFFHKPVIAELGKMGEVEPIEMLCVDLETHYDPDDDETIKRMIRKGRKFISEKYDFFPPKINEEDWWRGGPRLLDESEIVAWLAGNITFREDTVGLQLASLDDKNCLEGEFLEMDLDDFQRAFKEPLNLSKAPKKAIIEFGVLPDDSFIIKIYT